MATRRAAASTGNTSSSSTPAATEQQPAPPAAAATQQQHQQQQSFPVVAPSTVFNIALHSLLVITVPFALFFTAHFGGFDSLFQLTGGCVPSKETKTYLGAGLAVLGVNLVIASFVVSAFREAPVPASKKRD